MPYWLMASWVRRLLRFSLTFLTNSPLTARWHQRSVLVILRELLWVFALFLILELIVFTLTMTRTKTVCLRSRIFSNFTRTARLILRSWRQSIKIYQICVTEEIWNSLMRIWTQWTKKFCLDITFVKIRIFINVFSNYLIMMTCKFLSYLNSSCWDCPLTQKWRILWLNRSTSRKKILLKWSTYSLLCNTRSLMNRPFHRNF